MLALVRSTVTSISNVALPLVGLASAVCFYVLSIAVSAEPAAESRDGWVAILQPASAIADDVQVQVSATAISRNPKPLMTYGAAMCGSGSFSGYFLIGGDARLDDLAIEPRSNLVEQRLPDGELRVVNVGDGSVSNLGSVQVLRVTVDQLQPCIGASSGEDFVGEGFRVEGRAAGAVAASTGGLVTGAVERWLMPYVGSLPGFTAQLGVFQLSGAVDGDFVRPRSLRVSVDAGPAPLNTDLSDARPATDSVDRASWYLRKPFQATVKARNSSRQASLQQWSVFAAILFGTCGSFVTSRLIHWPSAPSIRNPSTPTEPMPEAARPPSSGEAFGPCRRWKWLTALGVGLLVGRLLGRERP